MVTRYQLRLKLPQPLVASPEILLFCAIDALSVRRVSSYPHQGDSLGPAGTAHDTPSLTAAQ